ncbi:hypothetical protein [Streptomyces sp. NBC_01217]|nr:hypothetical protein OG507_11955 [Streptomyces sp. NBC_01217]
MRTSTRRALQHADSRSTPALDESLDAVDLELTAEQWAAPDAAR